MEKKDFLLKRYEYQLKNYTDSNQAMIEFSKMALRGTMLLNGAAVIPIVYSKVEYLYPCAIIFGIGALIYYPSRTSDLTTEEGKEVQKAHTLKKALLPVRFFAMLLVAGSLVAFGIGLTSAYTAISSMQKKQEQTQITPPQQQKIQAESICHSP